MSYLHAFLSADTDSDVSSLDHRDIVRSVAFHAKVSGNAHGYRVRGQGQVLGSNSEADIHLGERLLEHITC